MENTFKNGDVVNLKSGSPNMTTESIGSYSGEVKAKCVWFDHSKKFEDMFSFHCLEISE